jgi:hypothetical protein
VVAPLQQSPGIVPRFSRQSNMPKYTGKSIVDSPHHNASPECRREELQSGQRIGGHSAREHWGCWF